jgi:hypothetical protein
MPIARLLRGLRGWEDGCAADRALRPSSGGECLLHEIGHRDDLSPFDPAICGALALFLFGVAVVAAYLPARRATTIDPVVALKDQ